MPKNRVRRGLVALSASAITAVYLAGYVHTRGADASIATIESSAPPATAVATVAPAAPLPTATPLPVTAPAQTRSDTRPSSRARGAPPPMATPVPQTRSAPSTQGSAPATNSQQSQYKDGTYSGSGTSRRGDVQVTVTVAGGRITGVNITRTTTQYPVRVIAALPGEVVSRQSAQVDYVSGATYSSLAFRQAVQQALSQAQA